MALRLRNLPIDSGEARFVSWEASSAIA